MPKKTARRIIDTRRDTGTTILTGVTLSGGGSGSAATEAMAGAGLTYNSGVLDVGAGTLLTVAADSVGITAGSTYQYIGTGGGTAAAWQNLSGLAGAGLTHTTGVLAVGAGSGLTVNADDVALTTPGTLTVSSTNSASGSHTHAVTSSADVTAGGTSLLASAAGNLKLATGNVASTIGYNGTFTSGFAGAGWQVDYGVTEAAKASATFDNLDIRGRMRVYELLIQQIRATNGSVMVSSSSKVFTVTNTTNPLWTVNGSQLTLNGANATLTFTWSQITTSDSDEDTDGRRHYHGFLVGDIIRAQQVEWNGSAFGGIIQSNLQVTSVANLYQYGAALVSGDAPAVGYDFVRLGSVSDTTRQGVVYLTSDDSNAPFIDIVDGIASHADWNTAGKIRARLGKLSGITDAQWGTLSGYGLWSDNVYLTGNIYATDGIFNGTVYANAGTFTGAITAQSGSIDGFLTIGTSGGIYQGTGTSGSPTTGLKIWNDGGIGRIGGYNSGALQWYASTDGYLYGGDGTNSRFRLGNESFRGIISTGTNKYGLAFIDTITASNWENENLYGTMYAGKATTSGSEDFRMFLYSRVNSSLYTTYDSRVDIGAQSNNGVTIRASTLVLTAGKNGGARRMTYSGDYFYIDGYMWFAPITAPGTPSTGVVLYCDSSDGKLKSKNTSGTTQNLSA